MKTIMKDLRKRKKEQLDICLKEDVEMTISNGFEKYQFVHQALPEIDFAEIDVSTKFLGKDLRAPILISSMVGGTVSSGRINQNLAKAAQKAGIAMGVGSQRIALPPQRKSFNLSKRSRADFKELRLKSEEIADSFQVRDVAPDILLLANFGAVQLNYGFGIKEAKRAVKMVRADGLILHLNPLQEVLQKCDQTNFKGVLGKIKKLVDNVNLPIIVKEVGCGISYQAAKKLYNAGVRIIDTAGAGGTSWAEIEALCASAQGSRLKAQGFKNWGIATAESLVQCKKVKGLRVIASGGIRNGIEIAKAIALGAELAGIGLPLLKPAQKSEKEVEKVLNQLIFELKLTMFCVGARNIEELKRVRLLE